MCNGISYQLFDGEKRCIPLYVDRSILVWPPDPEPGPWTDLQVIATINELTSHLRDASLRSQITETLRNSAEKIASELPKEFQLGDEFLVTDVKVAAD